MQTSCFEHPHHPKDGFAANPQNRFVAYRSDYVI
jgi:hypothetical protein